MVRASHKHGVPLGMLYAVGLTETGRGDSLRPFALNVDGIRTSCEGFIDSSPHAPSTDADGAPNDDGMQWYDVTAQPLDHAHVIGWAELPACPI
jgi:hypothetical protein